MRRVAIFGYRFYPIGILNRLLCKIVSPLTDEDLIISGGGGKVDENAEELAKDYCVPYLIYPANWDKYGKAAGPIRNKKIEKAASEGFGFWHPQSKGTVHTMKLFLSSGKPLVVYDHTGTELELDQIRKLCN